MRAVITVMQRNGGSPIVIFSSISGTAGAGGVVPDQACNGGVRTPGHTLIDGVGDTSYDAVADRSTHS